MRRRMSVMALRVGYRDELVERRLGAAGGDFGGGEAGAEFERVRAVRDDESGGGVEEDDVAVGRLHAVEQFAQARRVVGGIGALDVGKRGARETGVFGGDLEAREIAA